MTRGQGAEPVRRLARVTADVAEVRSVAEAGVPALVDLLPVPVVCLDANCEALFANASWTGLTGRPARVGRDPGWLAVVSPTERVAFSEWVRVAVGERRSAVRDVWVQTVIGDRLLRLAGQPHVHETGRLRWYMLCATDVTEQVAREERLLYAAEHDALTGLPNRTGFLEPVRDLASNATLTGRRAALLFLDLNDFKAVNDLGGHGAGDAVLRMVGGRLRAAVRPMDFVARIGGDEFAVLLPGVGTLAAARTLADRFAASVAQPMLVQGRTWRVSASIGIALTLGSGAADLLAAADASLCTAKALRKGDPGASPTSTEHTGQSWQWADAPIPSTKSARTSGPETSRPLHAVHFYGDDDDLIPALVGYAGAGLFEESVIVVASAEHRRRLTQGLDQQFLNKAQAEGRYVAMDAAETLHRIMRGGLPDPDLFRMVVGTAIRRAAAEHGKVRAYGEMVAILWAEGRAAAAMRLEDMWNGLQQEVAFPLLCAYPLALGYDEADTALGHICARHSTHSRAS